MLPKTSINPAHNPTQYITIARAEAYWIEKSRKDPLAFIHYVTGMKPAAHHIRWVQALLSEHRVNIIAPRESAKTTILVMFLTWVIAKDPLKTHFIGSVSAGQAEDRLSMIRELIETNERFRNVFPHIHIDGRRTNNKSEFTVWSSEGGLDYNGYRTNVSLKGDMKNPTICAFGIGSSQVIGKRFSGIVCCDDLHSDANSATAALRQKVEDWFNRTLLPCVKEEGRVAVICTRWAPDDMSGRIAEKVDLYGQPLWHTIEIPAINKAGESYWPEYWPVAKLQNKQAEVGEVMFQLMFLNNPLGMSSNMFKLEMLRKPLPVPLPEFKSVVISVDLAILEKSSSDYSVFAAIGRDAKPKYYDMYILDLLRARISSERVIDELIEFCDRMSREYTIEAVLFENQALTLSSFNEFRGRESNYKPKLVPLKGDKGARLFGVSLKAQRGGLFINQDMPTHAALISELIGFPKTEHDDIVDAVSLSLQYWGSNERESGTIRVQSPFML